MAALKTGAVTLPCRCAVLLNQYSRLFIPYRGGNVYGEAKSRFSATCLGSSAGVEFGLLMVWIVVNLRLAF